MTSAASTYLRLPGVVHQALAWDIRSGSVESLLLGVGAKPTTELWRFEVPRIVCLLRSSCQHEEATTRSRSPIRTAG